MTGSRRAASPELHILPTAREAIQAAGEFTTNLSRDAVHKLGRFAVALSGGSTPRGLYLLLASPQYARRIDWRRWQVFWSDERCVPPDHEYSNYRMAREALLDRVPIPPLQIHRMRGEVEPHEAALEYEAVLKQVFQGASPAFDLILLGLGEDGHIASLFPGIPALLEKQRLVTVSQAPNPPSCRITFTLTLINMSTTVAFLVTGGSKAETVRQVMRRDTSSPVLPATLVHPSWGSVHWFLDKEAARLLG
jgi:6-phosphogluconolactonase